MIQSVIIELDKPRRLRFGMGAANEFEQLTGKKVAEFDDNFTMELCSELIWAMLRQEEPDLTLKDTVKLIDENAISLADVIKKTSQAIRVAFDTGEKSPNVVKQKSHKKTI